MRAWPAGLDGILHVDPAFETSGQETLNFSQKPEMNFSVEID